MSKTKIDIDFGVACSQANRLEEIAESMARLANKQVAGTVEKIDAAWKGDSAAEYMQKAMMLQSSILQTSQQLMSVAASIRAEAKRIYNAEKAALEIATTDNY